MCYYGTFQLKMTLNNKRDYGVINIATKTTYILADVI